MASLAATQALAQPQGRISSDFEIAQMQQQVARSRDFVGQLSARLNLGDAYMSRTEMAAARQEYARALEIAQRERIDARRDSDLARYSTATAYAGLAQAKLGKGGPAFDLLEESIRYTSGSAKSWNLYASAMTILGHHRKAAAVSRHAVYIARGDVERTPSLDNKLDLAVYEFSLASALIETRQEEEAERLLRQVSERMRGRDFDELRSRVVRLESFEVYSAPRGDAAAYLSLHNRVHLRLGALLERRGERAAAAAAYRRVLESRTDDATALAALARLASTAEERERYFAASFDANPFSMSLIREYQRHLRQSMPKEVDDSTTGGTVRRTLVQIARGETRPAREALERLQRRFPGNATLAALRREVDAPVSVPTFLNAETSAQPLQPPAQDLRQLLRALTREALQPQHRSALDQLTFVSTIRFEPSAGTPPAGQSIFEWGTIGDVPVRFSEPTAFLGAFAAGDPLRLTYRVLGASAVGDRDALLVEPLQLGPLP